MAIPMSACTHDIQTTETCHYYLRHLNKKGIQQLPNMALGLTGSPRAEGGLTMYWMSALT